MTATQFELKKMLQTYDKQLVSARRIARLERQLRLASGRAELALPSEVKRKELVERVAREVIDNLLVTGVRTPVVDEIVEALEDQTGEHYLFEFSLATAELEILRETEHGPEHVNGAQRAEVLAKLWEITLAQVDQTMV